jgi:Ca-activated chloride channel homolog
LYRSGEYEAAAQAFARARSATAHYNRGNALARLGELDAAIDAYQRVLDIDPDHADARFNKALLEDERDQQSAGSDDDKTQQQPGGDRPDDGAAPDTAQDPMPGDDTPADEPPPEGGERDDQPGDDGDAERGDDEERSEELLASRDEQQEALEQWLRRVPDDPGGLLRRKFQYETNQRLRRGEIRSTETEKIW